MMVQVEAISQINKIPVDNAPLPKVAFKEAESFSDALAKIKHGNLKLSEKQLSVAGTICVAFAVNILLFGEKLKLSKWGKLSPIVGALTLISGTLGILFCAESFGKKAERKISKLFNSNDALKETIAKQNNPEKPQIILPGKQVKNGADIPQEDYKNLGIKLSHN